MKKLRTSAVWTIFGFIICLFLLLWLFFTSRPSTSTSINSTMLKNSIENASDLITTEYNYAKVGKFENSHEINGWQIPFTQKNFLLTYQGQVKLGINARDLEITVRNNKVIVDCPPIEVISNTIEEESIEIYDESMNLLNPISIQDYLDFATVQKQTILKELDEKNVIEEAKAETQRSLTQLLEMIPELRENYTIEIHFSDDQPTFASSIPPEEVDENSAHSNPDTDQTESSSDLQNDSDNPDDQSVQENADQSEEK